MCRMPSLPCAFSMFFFFFNDTATTEIYTLSLHDALPIYLAHVEDDGEAARARGLKLRGLIGLRGERSEEHTSELQSRQYLVCRLLLEKKKKQKRAADNSLFQTTTDETDARVHNRLSAMYT